MQKTCLYNFKTDEGIKREILDLLHHTVTHDHEIKVEV